MCEPNTTTTKKKELGFNKMMQKRDMNPPTQFISFKYQSLLIFRRQVNIFVGGNGGLLSVLLLHFTPHAGGRTAKVW